MQKEPRQSAVICDQFPLCSPLARGYFYSRGSLCCLHSSRWPQLDWSAPPGPGQQGPEPAAVWAKRAGRRSWDVTRAPPINRGVCKQPNTHNITHTYKHTHSQNTTQVDDGQGGSKLHGMQSGSAEAWAGRGCRCNYSAWNEVQLRCTDVDMW